MNKLKTGGGKSLGDRLSNPKNRKKMYDSDREDAKELSKWREEEKHKGGNNKN